MKKSVLFKLGTFLTVVILVIGIVAISLIPLIQNSENKKIEEKALRSKMEQVIQKYKVGNNSEFEDKLKNNPTGLKNYLQYIQLCEGSSTGSICPQESLVPLNNF